MFRCQEAKTKIGLSLPSFLLNPGTLTSIKFHKGNSFRSVTSRHNQKYVTVLPGPNFFILTKVCVGALPNNLTGRSELGASFTTHVADTLRSNYGFLFVIRKLCFQSIRTDRRGATCSSVQPGHPCRHRCNVHQAFLPRVELVGFPVAMRKLRMRRPRCATSVAPCCAPLSSALALYRWLRLQRQVYRFIQSVFFLFSPVPFSTRTASETDFFSSQPMFTS